MKCRWCQREGNWPEICMNTQDMEEKPHDAICDGQLLELGGGERSVNQARAAGGVTVENDILRIISSADLARDLIELTRSVRAGVIDEAAQIAELMADSSADGCGEIYIARKIADQIRALAVSRPSGKAGA